MEIKNNIIKSELVDWHDLKTLQPPNLKIISEVAMEKLKNSIVSKNFICSFYVWEDGKNLWVLDGVHRIKALRELEKEGYTLPEKLTVDFIGCANRAEAIKMILVYSSQYADITSDGIVEFIRNEGIDFDNSIYDIPEFSADEIERKLNVDIDENDLPVVEPRPQAEEIRCPKCGSRNFTREVPENGN